MDTRNRIGEKNYNSYGTLMKIIEYNHCENIIIEFQDKYKEKVCTRYDVFKKGQVSNPYDKTVLNVGYLRRWKV